MKQFLQKLEEVNQHYENELQNLGLQIRNEVVQPICKLYDICFVSTKNSFFFNSRDKRTQWWDSRIDYPQDSIGFNLKAVIELLDTKVNGHLQDSPVLGTYIGDVSVPNKI